MLRMEQPSTIRLSFQATSLLGRLGFAPGGGLYQLGTAPCLCLSSNIISGPRMRVRAVFVGWAIPTPPLLDPSPVSSLTLQLCFW